jgi:hypothetical protein
MFPIHSIHSRPRALLWCTVAACAALAWTGSSFAQDTTTVAPARATAAETATVYAGPNRILVSLGLTTLGLAYTPAIIVAIESPLNADKALYAPVAGPWIDLANRPDCGLRHDSCDLEMVNKVLVATTGVFQSIGALAVIASFVLPERPHKQEVGKSAEPSLHVVPARLGNGYGMTAIGTF